MKRVALIVGAVLLVFFVFRACGEKPEESARDTVKEFIDEVQELIKGHGFVMIIAL